MSIPWPKRKARLTKLLDTGEESGEDALSLALDRILHGQSVIGKTSKTSKIEKLRFTDDDLDIIGTLEYGQFAVIDVVSCKLDGRVYVRKSIEKRLALRNRDQCSPQLERDILLSALKTETEWAPHLLCAFQTTTHLNLVMDYAEGGTLWDILESSPLDGKISESDMKWWAPQVVSAIHWCHTQGIVHRDVKPHNFVLKADARLMIIDFGSAAPLLPLQPDGSQQVPKRHCMVPCGTCDYISPEILQAHEAALVALEMSDEPVDDSKDDVIGGYGRETDWWSLGAMLYELVYGVAPFFAKDIRQTYLKIMDHGRSLHFDRAIEVSRSLRDLLRRLLTDAELRLGRCEVKEVQEHPFFTSVDWHRLHLSTPPADLHLPQFTYSTPIEPPKVSMASSQSLSSDSNLMTESQSSQSQSYSRGFAFSALFQSSSIASPGVALVRSSPSPQAGRPILREQTVASFIGFSWGPTNEAIQPVEPAGAAGPSMRQETINTPRPIRHTSVPLTPHTFVPPTPGDFGSVKIAATPRPNQLHAFATPVRPNMMSPYGTLPRASTIRRTAPRRAVSDREAMKQLADCVGMSARKKVLESGRKPRILDRFNFGPGSNSKSSSTLKELRFDRSVMVMNDAGISFRLDPPASASTSLSASGIGSLAGSGASGASSILNASQSVHSQSQSHSHSLSMLSRGSRDNNTSFFVPSDSEDTSMETSDIPPSPSPSPRPGSAMSMLSRRSQTPTITGSYLLRTNGTSGSRNESTMKSHFLSPLSPVDLPWRTAPQPPVSGLVGVHPEGAPPEADDDHDSEAEMMAQDVWEGLQRRHDLLMTNIANLTDRLSQVSRKIADGVV